MKEAEGVQWYMPRPKTKIAERNTKTQHTRKTLEMKAEEILTLKTRSRARPATNAKNTGGAAGQNPRISAGV